MKSKVGLYACKAYDPKEIERVLRGAFAQSPEWIEDLEGKSVYLKLNLLLKKKPEEAVTTHPAVVEAVCRILADCGAGVTIGDSPGGPYLPARLKNIYRVCGIEAAAQKTGARLNYDISEVSVPFHQGKAVKSFVLTGPVAACDKVISISKLKTHMMAGFTGAVKNLFGTVPGLKKVEYHLKMPDVDDFCGMLVDLALCVSPALNIMDAITAMEGEGPSAGKPRHVGALLLSSDPFALDAAALTLLKIDPESIPAVRIAKARGLAAARTDLELVGDDLANWDIRDFQVPAGRGHVRFPVPELLTRRIRPRPVFQSDKCVGCGDCALNCPPGALKMELNMPRVDLEACIRCFCCHEMCPRQAVEIRRSLLGRLLNH